MWPTIRREQCLPALECVFGYQQRQVYEQPDLYHEEVMELETPFQCIMQCSPSVETQSVLLLGDQNAGKTTFLHAFVWRHDANFTRLTSHLPILSAVFLNSRFLEKASSISPMDEPPFLDTDLARTTVLFGMDDWNFFLSEQGLPHCESRATYFVLQLLEIGGDHLDRLMARESDEVCMRSRELLSRVASAAYVMNGNATSPQRRALMVDRLTYLREVNPRLRVELFASRGEICGIEARPFSVLDKLGDLDVGGIVSIVTSLAGSAMMSAGAAQGKALVVESLLHFWTAKRAELYLEKESFYHHLSHSDCCAAGHTCVPSASLVSEFDAAVKQMIQLHLMISSADGRFSRLVFAFSANHDAEVSFGNVVADEDQGKLVRFPVFEPLLRAMCLDYVSKGVSSEFWCAPATRAHRESLALILPLLEAQILQEWRSGSHHAFILLVEDWWLAMQRVRETPFAKLDFPMTLPFKGRIASLSLEPLLSHNHHEEQVDHVVHFRLAAE